MKRLVIVVAGILALLALMSGPSLGASAADPDMEATLRLFYQAVSRGDAVAAAAFFAEDGVMVTGGACTPLAPCTGRADVQRGIAQLAAVRASFGILNTRATGNTMEAMLETWNVNVQNFGFQRTITKANATFNGDKIQRLVQELDLTDPQSLEFSRFQGLIGLVDANTTLLNRSDAAAMLALYADDGIFEGFGLCAATPCRGKEAIRAEVEREVQEHASIFTAIGGAQRAGNGIANQRAMRSDATRAAGVDRIFLAVNLEAFGGKITRLRFSPIEGDAQTAAYLAATHVPLPLPIPVRLPAAGNAGLRTEAPVAQPGAAQATDLEALLRLYYQAVDRGDIPAQVASFTDDAVYIGGACSPQLPCSGKAEIQQRQLQADLGNKVSFGVLSSSVSGATVTARVEQWNLNVQNAGLQRVMLNVTITFQGEKIARYVAALDLSDAQSVLFTNVQRVNQTAASLTTAIQRGDVAAALALFADNAVVEGGPLCAPVPCSGKEAIQKEIERRIADHTTQVAVEGSVRVSGDIRASRGEVRADSARAAGAERILVDLTTEVQGNRITSERAVPVAGDPQTAAYLASLAVLSPAGLPRTGTAGLKDQAKPRPSCRMTPHSSGPCKKGGLQ